MMDLHEEGTDTYAEIFHSISTSSYNSSPKELSPSHDFHPKATQVLEDPGANRVSLYSSFSDTFPSGIFDEGQKEGFFSHSKSPFQTMIAPAVAVEPPTPHENAFRFSDFSHSGHGVQKSQTRFEPPLRTCFDFHDPRGSLYSSPTEAFSTCQNVSPTTLHNSSLTSHSFYGDASPAVYAGVPIARSNVKSRPDVTLSARKVSRHHRDLSGASSTTSSLSGPPYDYCPAIDPSALQPPLRKLQTETSSNKNEVNNIISPFINQVLEHGPDGTMTGRYSRPLTSTGKPSHARKTPPGHVKRPRNAFILFRSHACASNLIPPAVEKDHRQISRIVSHMWKSLPAGEKVKWEREAEAEKELHRKLHPDYRYKPIYRKENPGKKNQGGLGSSSSTKKKSNCQKKLKGMNFDNTECLSKDSENYDAVHQKSPDQLQQERDEEIRCEAVAKVLMETKLTGIKLGEGEMEERVVEQVRLAKENDANRSHMKSQSQVVYQSDQATSSLVQTIDPNALSIPGSQKPKNKVLAPLQARRKSLLNRSNSAPPPPSPLRTMHVMEVVYNPKARGGRELSPDFPKPKLMTEEDMKIENIAHQSEISHATLFPGSFHSQPPIGHNFNPFAALSTRNPWCHHHQGESTPSQELEQLFHTPDFAFADEHCFRSQPNDNSHGLFTSQMSDQDDYPIFNALYTETMTRYRKDPPPYQRYWENFSYQNEHYSSELCDPLTKLTEDHNVSQFLETSRSNVEKSDSSIVCDENPSSANRMGDDFLNDFYVPQTLLNEFTSSVRRKSSITMPLTGCSSPQLIQAVELAKKNMTVFSDSKEKWCNSLNEPTKRRHSVMLSGLGEFPIMDLPIELTESNQQKTTSDIRMECEENGETYGNMTCGLVSKEPQVFNESRRSIPGITFESGIGPDGQTYLFVTKEQAETEGLIAQILDAGFGVTYETDIPQEEN